MILTTLLMSEITSLIKAMQKQMQLQQEQEQLQL